MDAWRHFGETFDLDVAPRECGERLAPDLPDESSAFLPHDLERLIEGEILPRLMLAHRETAAPRERLVERRASPLQINRFCTALLDPRAEDVDGHVQGLLGEGLPLSSLLLDLLAPAARHLGELWEEDECDFVDVTMALGRLNATARTLCSRLDDGLQERAGRSILLIPSPGETHTFCLTIVASVFRDAGWTVTTSDVIQSLTLARAEWFDVIGMTLSCDVCLPALAGAIRDLRRGSCNEHVRVIVGGSSIARHPEPLRMAGADALAADVRLAPALAQSLLDKRAQAC